MDVTNEVTAGLWGCKGSGERVLLLPWPERLKNNCRAIVNYLSSTSSKLPSQTSLCQAWTRLVSDGCVFSDEPANVERAVKRKELDGIMEFLRPTILSKQSFKLLVVYWCDHDCMIVCCMQTWRANVGWNALTWSFSDAAIPVYGNSQSC